MATLDLTFPTWKAPGPAPALGDDAVHIWRIDLDGRMANRQNVLSSEERARAARMGHEGARATFQQARTALRLILGFYMGEAPSDLRIVLDARGKPRLDHPDAPGFNLSHAGGLALVAVTRGAAVGVDIEFIRLAPRLDELAARFFAPAEVAQLRALPEAQRLDAFHACWTRKEAFVKAEGSGLAHALAGFTVSLAPDQPAALLSIEGCPSRAAFYTLHGFRPAPGAWGAVCIDAPDILANGFTLQID